ncbi:hypothetical protein HXX76_009741 [Chlamydomonas incerta]|uniref:Uncharacterized protein n=1 Tax=Chlamydomonas incerta TaxID=51695 RepID=A0A835SQ86_CHLIN|nr:hypothetical protein HXX76_009741 [Chlamydomonas incerta]|eukprot:KAG2431213.1 hypothetical protein HXX76_009741 [Chlamydomonas incerta]
MAAAPWPGWQFLAHWGAPEPWRALTLNQRQRVLCLAASSGDEPSLDAALAHCGCLSSQALISAARAGQGAACQRLLAEGCQVELEAACAAAEAGHLSLCSLLWRKRLRDYEFYGDVVEAAYMASSDAVRVAEAACFAGYATVLRPAAAPLCDVALGCPLPVFRELAERWRQLEPPQPGASTAGAAGGDGSALLLSALGSRTPDWKDKVELVVARRPDYLAATVTGAQVHHSLFEWAAAQPDFEQRLRYLVTDKCAGAAVAQAAAVAAAGAGDVGALRFLLDECGVRLADNCICEAAAHGQHAVLEFLRGRGQLLSLSCDGRALDPSAAPVCVLAATAVVAAAEPPSHSSSQAANQLGAEVQLQPIAEAGSVEQLEWALGAAAGLAGVAVAQGPAPAEQRLLLAALAAGNLAAASHLHACGLAPVLPAALDVIGRYCRRITEPGSFGAVRWLVEQRRAGQAAAAGAGGAAGADNGAAGAVDAGGAAAAGEAAAGLADAEWATLLHDVGVDGRLRGRYSGNQWKWLKAAFLDSPVRPHATAASTARDFGFSRATNKELTGMPNKRMQEAAPSAVADAEGSGHEPEPEAEREREREEGVMAARRLVVAEVKGRFRQEVEMEEQQKADAVREAQQAEDDQDEDEDENDAYGMVGDGGDYEDNSEDGYGCGYGYGFENEDIYCPF